MIKNIVTIAGPPCVGKSTVGKLLSDALNARFIDLDEEIEKTTNCSVCEIFENKTEEFFRDIEQKTIKQIVNTTGNKTILSLGGGALLDQQSKKLILDKTILFTLTARVETLLNRNSGKRPLASSRLIFENLLKLRKEHYGSLPNQINTENKSPLEIVEFILKEVHSLWFQ